MMTFPGLDSFRYNLFSIPVFVVSSFILFFGLFVWSQNKKAVANFAFLLICLAINFWFYGLTFVYSCKTANHALFFYKIFTFLGVAYIPSTVYFFSVAWLKLFDRQKKWVILGLAGSFLFYALALFTPWGFDEMKLHYWGYFPKYGISNKIFLLFFFPYFLAAFLNFAKNLYLETDSTRRKQVRMIYIAFIISFFSSFDFVPKFFSYSLYPIGYISVLIWIGMVAYAIVSYRALDIETVIHKTAMWFVTSFCAIIPFALVVYAGHQLIPREAGILGTGFNVILILLFYGYFKALEPHLDRIFRRKMVNMQRVSDRFAKELVHLKGLRDLLQSTARLLRRSVFATSLSIYLRDEERGEFHPAIVKRMKGLSPIGVNDPVLEWFKKSDSVAVLEFDKDAPECEHIKANIEAYAQKMQAVVVVPLVVAEKLIGMIHLGKKDNLKRYSAEDVSFLSRLKASISIAFSNTLHVIAMQENLQKWNDELERKVEERTNQLQETQSQLVQAEKLATIGTLAGGVAHEINNPLTAVLTNAQILKMTANPDDLESISLIEEGAKRCQFIVQKLMKYARKPMGPEVMGRVDLNKVVDNTAAFLRYQMEQENIKIVLVKASQLPFIEGNSNELEQVLTNLILNAKDAVKQAGRDGVITISTEILGGKICLKVADNGVGIPEANIAKIFDPFFTTKEIGKGTGLGLAVTMGIVQKHGGTISVESKLGIGTMFKVSLN